MLSIVFSVECCLTRVFYFVLQALVGPNAAEIFDEENRRGKNKHRLEKARSSTLHHLTYIQQQ